MLDQITPLQWEEWKLYGVKRPFGDRRADLRNALLAMAIDCIVSGLVGADPGLDPSFLMPFDDVETEADGGWENPELTFAKLEAMSIAQRSRSK